jgi:alpha-amylase
MEWIKTTNIYEVNLRQYTEEGTIRAFMPHLERLKDMGVETLWFMPITPIAQKNKKGTMGSYYACKDYTGVDAEFGTMEDWRELVRTAKEQGFRVILDWVANHTGWDHVWTIEHPDWYLKDEDTGEFHKASGMDDIIELDYSNPALRRAMIEAMIFWMDTGIDGFRCDLADWVELSFWIEAKEALDRIRPLFWLAELDPLQSPDYMQVFDSAYSWEWMHKTREFYQQRGELSQLEAVLDRYQQAPGIPAWFTTNHDENSWNGTEYEKYGELALPLAVFSCTWQGIPLLYSGQELPNRKRLQFFDKDPIEWTGSYELHGFYKTLLNLHSTHPALHAGVAPQRLPVSSPGILAWLRTSGGASVCVFMNFTPHPARFTLPSSPLSGRFKNLFTGFEYDFSRNSPLELGPWEWWVYVRGAASG